MQQLGVGLICATDRSFEWHFGIVRNKVKRFGDMAELRNSFYYIAQEIQHGGRKHIYEIIIFAKSGRFTVRRHHYSRAVFNSSESDELMFSSNIRQQSQWWDLPTIQYGGRKIGRHIEFLISLDDITGKSMLHRDGNRWKYSGSSSNHIFICYRPKIITTSGLAAAILIYVHNCTKNNITLNPLCRRDLIMSKTAAKSW